MKRRKQIEKDRDNSNKRRNTDKQFKIGLIQYQDEYLK